jgi:hypothetical protein
MSTEPSIKIHFDDLAVSIKNGGLGFWNSKWVRLWVAHSSRGKKPKVPFSPPPELIHVQGLFNEEAFYREIEGKPFELQEITAPEWTGIKQVYADSFVLWQEKYRSRNIHPVFENDVEWLERNLNTERSIEIQPMYMAGEERPPTYKFGEKPRSSSDNNNAPPTIHPQEPDIEVLHPGNTKPKRQTRERLKVLCKCHDKNLTIEEILNECKKESPDLFHNHTLDKFSKGTGNLWQLAQGYGLIPKRK